MKFFDERLNGLLQRLGSPVVFKGADPEDWPIPLALLAALEAIEIRLDRLDGHLQFRDERVREEDLAILAGLAGITFDTDAGLDDQPGETLPVKAID